MSISYSGIIGYGSGKATLPSVDTWGTSMNILKDPPKSIHTRQNNNHILLTSEITQMIQDSGDRVNEAILVYPRGVNPMVDVSYDNYGNNGGQRRANITSAGLVDGSSNSGKQSYLPYRIMQGGAFRPPTRDQRELLPLSRLPRTSTSSYTQPGFADFSKKLQTPSDNEKGTKKPEDVLRWNIRPTMTYKIETPIVETYEVKNVIKKILPVPKTSGIQPQQRYNGEIGEPVKQIISEPRKAEIILNKGSSDFYKNPDLDHFDTSKYTHEVLQGDNRTNLSHNIQITPIDELLSIDTSKYTHQVLQGDNRTNLSHNIQITPINELFTIDTNNKIKEHTGIYYDTPQSGYTKYDYIHDDVQLERTLPYHEGRTNIGHNIHKKIDGEISQRTLYSNRPSAEASTNLRGPQNSEYYMNREYVLKPTINPGGFESVPSIPSVNRDNNVLQDFNNDKSKMRQRIYEMQQDRNINLGNIPYSVPQNAV